ncbi:protein NETWORKED 2A-like [Arachis duranensis]|uniref:Protein NETWORKED 2A-like n=1 Tax=Arachis duranensis TaxID=130453 RepID=A0A6P5MZP4_ARADU|nr:protein NETWORKED 2A-like [Arachis duranensis]XP_020990164.2 protein NETWORKED 2A-like [Arachis duranensis]
MVDPADELLYLERKVTGEMNMDLSKRLIVFLLSLKFNTDMEERVFDTLRTLQDEGDSFATRAEMYYKKRPELVSFVEESFRSYRALAERYDKLSKDLQSANRTIASVFPDQVHYRTEEEDEDDDEEEEEKGSNDALSPKSNNGRSTNNNNNNNEALIPKVPNIPKKGCFRSPSMLLSRKGSLPKRTTSPSEKDFKVSGSGLSKEQALGETDKLQKDILTLQTEKEFVRSLYERAYTQYWEIEDRITAMQKSVSKLQDEYGVGTVIEDNEARTLMAATALKSCQVTLAKLQEIQAQSSEEARVEFERVKEAHEMFESLRDQFISKYMNQDESKIVTPVSPVEEENDMDDAEIQAKVKETKLEEDSSEVITVTEMADKINQLVSKVVTLETTVSSQTGLVQRLRSETDELQTNIKKLEEEKDVLIEGSEVTNQKLKEVEEELRRVKLLNRSVRSQDNTIKAHFIEASYDIKHLSEKLNNMKPDVEEENMVLYKKENNNDLDGKQGNESQIFDENVKALKEEDGGDVTPERIQNMGGDGGEIESHDLQSVDGKGDEPDWRQLYISGLDDREKILLEEYTSVLRDYKDVKIKLNDVEKKNRDSIFELALQLRELKNALANKDQEIIYLHHKLNSPNSAGDNSDVSPFTMATEYKYTPNEALLREAEAQEANLPTVLEKNSPLITSDANPIKSPSSDDSSHLKMNEGRLEGLSSIEKKFRSDMDDILEKSLEFWLRFGTSINQIQKYQNSIQDLKADLCHIQESHTRSSSEGHSSKRTHLQSQLKPIFKHLREIRTELSLWLEHNTVLQVEMQDRNSSLCHLHDEIIRASNNNGEEEKEGELTISPYQAAKFQGEIMNLKQQNNTVASELQAGLSLVSGMKNDVEKTLDELDLVIAPNKKSSSHGSSKNDSGRPRVPLKSLLFGAKLKKHKQKQSLFSCVNPTVHKSDMEDEAGSPIHTQQQ